MLFEEEAVLIQKPKLWKKGIVEASDRRDRISPETEREVPMCEKGPLKKLKSALF